jgi:menaquinone-dependent protoporphyrinogen oxidase
MTSVLVAYATKHGSTAEIAHAIADELRESGLAPDVREAGDVQSIEDYDAVIIGSAVYMRRWRREAKRLLKRESRHLAERPFWIFSSGDVGENPDSDWVEPSRVVALAEGLGVREHVVFGGRLPLDPGNFVERAMVKNTPREKRDLRDWDEIRHWADQIAESLAGDPTPIAATRGTR